MTDFDEAFTRLTCEAADGNSLQWTGHECFAGMLTGTGSRCESAGRTASRVYARLTCADTVPLRPGDRVRRERDGAVFTVIGDTVSTPAFSRLHLQHVAVEGTVTA